MKARILLAADVDGPGLSDGHIVEMLGTSRFSVERVRQRLVEEGLEAALNRKKQERPSRPPRRAASSSASNGTTRPSTAAG